MGMSTIMLAICHWYVCSNPNVTVVYCSHNTYNTQLGKSIFKTLNPYLKFVTEKTNEIKFDNDSQMLFRNFTPRAFRGLSINMLMIDNASWIKSNKAWESAKSSFVGPYIWINGTPKKQGDWFHKMWCYEPGFFLEKIPWYKREDNDEEWVRIYKSNFPNTYKQDLEAEFV